MNHYGVCLAYVTAGRVTSQFHLSVLRTVEAQRGLIVGHVGIEGGYIARNRNLAVREFLAGRAEWLWFIDDDIVFPPETLPALLDVADDPFRPILGACYFGQSGKNWLPLWTEDRDGDPYAPVEHVEPGRMYRLSATGMGCTLIHRGVITAVGDAFSEDPDPWFGHDIVEDGGGRRRAGEDTTFCRRAASVGFQTWGLAFVVGHHKTATFGWEAHR